MYVCIGNGTDITKFLRQDQIRGGGGQYVCINFIEAVAGFERVNDGLVDLTDWRALIDCLAGPGVPPDPFVSECAFMCVNAFDADGSGTVDLKDAAGF